MRIPLGCSAFRVSTGAAARRELSLAVPWFIPKGEPRTDGFGTKTAFTKTMKTGTDRCFPGNTGKFTALGGITRLCGWCFSQIHLPRSTTRGGSWHRAPAFRAFIACIICLFVAPAFAQSTPADLLATAESAFERAESLLESDPAAATVGAGLDESIAAYLALIEQGVENAAIHRNIGTAFLLKDDLGRAIVGYRRAERLDPTDHRVQESLAAARALVRSEVARGTRSRVEDAVLFWRGRLSRDTMLTVGLVGWAVAWIGASIRIVSRRGTMLVALGAALAVVTLGSLAAERSLQTMNPAAVIVQDGVVGFRGPSESVYDPTFEQPIRVGVEATILEHRDGWTRLRLRSGSETWVRADAIEQI